MPPQEEAKHRPSVVLLHVYDVLKEQTMIKGVNSYTKNIGLGKDM